MDLLAEVLKPIPLVVWGGPALEYCGVKAFIRVSAMILLQLDKTTPISDIHAEVTGLHLHRQ